MSFFDRSFSANIFAQRVFCEIEKMGFTVAMNGTEHTHPNFVSNLRQSTDQTSLAIRFQPDGVACIGNIPKTIYVEVKNATHIERLAYEQYIKLQQVGNIVIVIFGRKYRQGWNWIENIRFIPSKQVVDPYPISNRFPIVEDDWIAPRKHPNYLQLKTCNMSGTDYKEVDESSLIPWELFKMLSSIYGKS
jgi:hypothetical protein